MLVLLALLGVRVQANHSATAPTFDLNSPFVESCTMKYLGSMYTLSQ